ncbi:hypothetical protein ABFS83_03G064200 [Erythranthe nasuta]
MAGHHLIKYIFLCWRGDGTEFWPGSPLRLCVVPLFFRFGHIQSLRHFNFQQLIGLITNIILTKNYTQKSPQLRVNSASRRIQLIGSSEHPRTEVQILFL